MNLKRHYKFLPKDGRETVFVESVGYPKGSFKEEAKKFANGLLNSHGGVIYFGIQNNGTIIGTRMSRKEEDEYRLAVDHAFGSMQPFVPSNLYRLNFLPVTDGAGPARYTVVELKVSVGEIGEIYEDGTMKVYSFDVWSNTSGYVMHTVFIVDDGRLVGPLFPQELKELILLKYKESLEGAEAAARFATPNLAVVRAKTRPPNIQHTKRVLVNRGLSTIIEGSRRMEESRLKQPSLDNENRMKILNEMTNFENFDKKKTFTRPEYQRASAVPRSVDTNLRLANDEQTDSPFTDFPRSTYSNRTVIGYNVSYL